MGASENKKNTVPHTCYLMVKIIGKRGKKRFNFFLSKTKRFGREKNPNTKQNMDKIYSNGLKTGKTQYATFSKDN